MVTGSKQSQTNHAGVKTDASLPVKQQVFDLLLDELPLNVLTSPVLVLLYAQHLHQVHNRTRHTPHHFTDSNSARIYRTSGSIRFQADIQTPFTIWFWLPILATKKLITKPDNFTYFMMTGFLPSLAYCTIFIVMSSEVAYLHICIFISTSTGHCLDLCTVE